MKIALITDQHLDARKGSLAFWDYFQKFYDDVFFPTLEKEGVKVVFDLGDTFDNRKTIDFNNFNRINENYFKRMKDYEVHMLLGNHCTYYKNTNKINSPELLLEQYDNIRVYSEPKEIVMGKKVFLMLPWINKENQEEVFGLLERSDADICCGHLELSGFEMTPGFVMDHGMDRNLFRRFKRVWSGHFHHKSKHGNIQYLGNPYQIYWNDYKDPRGFHLYEPSKNKLKYIKNPNEIFKKIYYNDSVDQDITPSDYAGCYVKLVVENKTNFPKFEKLIDDLYSSNVLDLKIIETLVQKDVKETDIDLEVTDTLSLLNEYIDEVEMSVNKNDLKSILRTLYIESCEVV